MAWSAASPEGLWVFCKDALLLRRLEKMDSTTGGRAVHTVAVSRPTHLYLGAAKVRGQWDHLVNLCCFILFHIEKQKCNFDHHLGVFLLCVDRLVLIRKPGSLLEYLFSWPYPYHYGGSSSIWFTTLSRSSRNRSSGKDITEPSCTSSNLEESLKRSFFSPLYTFY